MACSIECYKEYMNRIEKSRTPVVENVEIENNENIGILKAKSRKKKIANSETNFENIIIEN